MSAHLPKVLKTLDETHDHALERLFELIRIPACRPTPPTSRTARRRRSGAPASSRDMGFDAKVVPTAGHPMVVAHDKNPP